MKWNLTPLFDRCDHYIDDLCDHHWFWQEEFFASILHIIGFGLSIAALVILDTVAGLKGSPEAIVGCTVFGFGLMFSYGSSGVYHLLTNIRWKLRFQVLDHIAIFILIAASYTPFMLVPLEGVFGWVIFGLIWFFAVMGIIFKLTRLGKNQWLSTTIYMLMGWLVIIAIVPLIRHLPMDGVLWLLAGGIAYTLGVIFFLMETIPFMHIIWHLFVLGGGICHFFAVLYYVAPIAGH